MCSSTMHLRVRAGQGPELSLKVPLLPAINALSDY